MDFILALSDEPRWLGLSLKSLLLYTHTSLHCVDYFPCYLGCNYWEVGGGEEGVIEVKRFGLQYGNLLYCCVIQLQCAGSERTSLQFQQESELSVCGLNFFLSLSAGYTCIEVLVSCWQYLLLGAWNAVPGSKTSSLLLWITLALGIRCACASSWLLRLGRRMDSGCACVLGRAKI